MNTWGCRRLRGLARREDLGRRAAVQRLGRSAQYRCGRDGCAGAGLTPHAAGGAEPSALEHRPILPITAVAEQLALPSVALPAGGCSPRARPILCSSRCCRRHYAFTGHKWACGPEGLGGVALSERVLEQGQPTVIGWRSLQDESKADLSSSDPFHHDSRRFEVATSCVPLMAGLRCSLDLLDKEGTGDERWARIQSRSEALWQALNNLDGLTPLLQVPPASGLVSFQLSHDAAPAEVVKQLGQQGLWIRDLADPSCLRACTHVTTTEAETKALKTAIARY